jgi:hypothetical protein
MSILYLTVLSLLFIVVDLSTLLVSVVLLLLKIQVSYLLQGSFRHEDFCGHKGVLNAGDLQVLNFKSELSH